MDQNSALPVAPQIRVTKGNPSDEELAVVACTAGRRAQEARRSDSPAPRTRSAFRLDHRTPLSIPKANVLNNSAGNRPAHWPLAYQPGT